MKKLEFKHKNVMVQKRDDYKKINSESKIYEILEKSSTEQSSLLINEANESKDDPHKA